MIPYGRQDITQEDIEAVTDVLRSDFLTQGPRVPSFEQAVASYVNAKFAIAVNSATSALHISCLALDLGPGDWLWTSPISFVASANCGLYCGARVDFVDIDPDTYNLCPKALEEKLIESKRTDRLPKVLVAVHFSGQSCDMAEIHALSIKYGFRVIEDASHAIGGKYRDSFIGSGLYSDITVFSFHPVKIITTAEGGMAVTNNERLAKKLALLRSHGITRNEDEMTHKSDGSWYYQQIELGYNYRMTELQGALGLSQLNRMSTFVTRRQELAKRYDELLIDLPLTTPLQQPDNYSAFHLYVVRLRLSEIHKTHSMVFHSLRDMGIGVNLHYIPIHTHPYFERLGFKLGDYPQAERYYAEAISLPIYYALTGSQQDIVLRELRRVIGV
jgi:UDP-4-amino-4,6-dideoxy-N-acetyl-beta-L-altrosamine transaminase